MIYVQLSQDGVLCCLRLFAFVFCGVYQRGRAGSSSVERRLPFRPRVAVLVLAWTLLFSSSSFSALSVLGPRPGGSGACPGTHSPALLSALGGGGEGLLKRLDGPMETGTAGHHGARTQNTGCFKKPV